MFIRAALVATMLLANVAGAASQCASLDVQFKNAKLVVRGKIVSSEATAKEDWQAWYKATSLGPYAMEKFIIQVEEVIKGELAERTVVVWAALNAMGYGSSGLFRSALESGKLVDLALHAHEGRYVSGACSYARAV